VTYDADGTDIEVTVLTIALDLADLLIEARGGARAAKTRVVKPLVPELKQVLIGRWKAEMDALLATDGLTKLSEADGEEDDEEEEYQPGTPVSHQRALKLAAALILAGIALSWPVTKEEVAQWEQLLRAAHAGGAARLARELGVERMLPEDAETAFLRLRGFAKLARDIDQTTRDRLRTAVADVYGSGGGYEEIVQAIRDVYDGFTATRADRIANTELSAAYNAGRSAMARELDMTHKIWNPDGDACEQICMPNVDEGAIPIDDVFSSGDDAPPAHPACLVSGTFVSALGVAAQTSRRYSGEIIVIRTSGMEDLSITPNHPVLTRRGWIAAGTLELSDELVQCLDPSAVFSAFSVIHPHDDYVEARIEEIAASFLMPRGVLARSVPSSAEAFDGDGQVNGEIDIVGSTSFLSDDGASRSARQNIVDLLLAACHLALSPLDLDRSPAQMGKTLHRAANGGVGRFGLISSLSRRHFPGADNSGRAAISLLEAECPPASENRTPANSGSHGDRKEALSGHVRFVQPTSIERRQFDGHVYNLQTETGLYIANHIVVHNCDCIVDFVAGEKD
jgi:hypothetical protein